MAKQDVDNYFKQMCSDYHDMIEALHDMEEEANKNLISPEQLDNMKKQVEQIKTNYLRISYIMYLFNRPNKKSKQKRYNKNYKFNEEDTLKGVCTENKNILNSLKIKS